MTPDEMTDVLERVRRSWPHQALDEMASVVWTETLGRYPHRDVVQAVREHAASSPFVSVAEVAERVRALRQARWIAVAKHVPEPNVDPDDVAAYRAEQDAIEARVLDGHWGLDDVKGYRSWGRTLTGAPVFTRGVLRERPVRAAIEAAGVGRDS